MAAWTGSFEWRAATGRVDVECIANDDPAGYGSWDPDAHGFRCAPRPCTSRSGDTTRCAIELRDIVALTSDDWEAQLPELRAEYPSPVWTLADSF